MHRKKVHIVGHRGAHGLAPENTLASFEKALEYNVAQIETDVRLTKDGVIVHVHNTHLRGHDGSEHEVAKTDFATLRALKPDIATLDESIAFVDRRTRLMIEVKAGVPTKPIVDVVSLYLRQGWEPEHFMFAAFDFGILKELHTALPQIDRVVLESWSGLRAMRRARQLDTPYLSMDQDVLWWGFVRSVSRRYKLFSYPYPKTSRLPYNHDKPKRWFRHGLYGAIVDYPDNFVAKQPTK